MLLVEIILTFFWLGLYCSSFLGCTCRREDSKSKAKNPQRAEKVHDAYLVDGSLVVVYALLNSAHDDLTPKHFRFFVILPQVDTADAYKHDRGLNEARNRLSQDFFVSWFIQMEAQA